MISAQSSIEFIKAYKACKRDVWRKQQRQRSSKRQPGSIFESPLFPSLPRRSTESPAFDRLLNEYDNVSMMDESDEKVEPVEEMTTPWGPNMHRRRSSIDPSLLSLPAISNAAYAARPVTFSAKHIRERASLTSDPFVVIESDDDEDIRSENSSESPSDEEYFELKTNHPPKHAQRRRNSTAPVSSSAGSFRTNSNLSVSRTDNTTPRNSARRKSNFLLPNLPQGSTTKTVTPRRGSIVPNQLNKKRKSVAPPKQPAPGGRRLSIVPPSSLAHLQQRYLQTLLEASSSSDSENETECERHPTSQRDRSATVQSLNDEMEKLKYCRYLRHDVPQSKNCPCNKCEGDTKCHDCTKT